MAHLNCLFLLLFFLSTHTLSSQSFNFTYNGFNDSDLVKQGATVIKPSGALRLTNISHNVIGHAFLPTPIPIFNSSKVSSFSTYFVFQIRPSGARRGGFGLAFILSPSTQFPGAAAGHFLGIFNSSNDGLSSNHVFLVEFDTVNGYKTNSDTAGNHVGINVNGMDSRASQPAAYYINGTSVTEEVVLESGEPFQAWIDYDGERKLVNVTIAPLSHAKPIRPLMSEPFDLSEVLTSDRMYYAGFSSATGNSKFSAHYILGWSFRLDGPADSLDLGRLPFVPIEKSSNSSLSGRARTALISSFSVLLLIFLVLLLVLLYYKRVLKFEVLEDWELDSPHRFKYRDLHKATRGFRENEIIGIGGFGAVYRGVLPTNGSEIAVKKIISKNTMQAMKEFAAEIESLGRLRHKNLVNLLGWCKHKNDLFLVYDYVPNGSLDSLLYSSSKKNGTVLNWEQRFKIIKGVASGLLYLHEEWEQVVIHRDVKSSNVLIDRDMNARLGDFGLARLYDHGKNAHTTNVVGTIGYIAPELTRMGRVSTSTDVFAYGILLLEVACGRAPVVCEAARNVILVDWVVECMEKGNVFDSVDRKLEELFDVGEMELVLGLGLLCSHPKPEARPKMRQVVKYLNGDEMLPVFDRLSEVGSRRVDEVTARFLALGLSESLEYYTNSTNLNNSSSIGAMSSGSLGVGR